MRVNPELEHYKSAALQIEYPDVESESYLKSATTPPPMTLDTVPDDYWDMSLDEAIRLALAHSNVLRDLGGLVLQAPGSANTLQGPAITETDPRFGVEAALSAFDASFESSLFFEKNDRALNNVFFGGGTRLLKQDLHSYQAEISKTSADGGRFSIRKILDYDFNNSPGNAQPNLPWTIQMEAEFRQPLLQGAGVDFNQIAGPNSAPGSINGVLVARINTDISLADFEIGVRNLIFDAENAYWELYYAYRALDAKRAARDRAVEKWRNVNALITTGRLGGEADKEAQAQEQFFRLQEEVQNALTGRMQDRIRTTVFRGVGGVQSAERRLRLLLGVPINDGKLIRPNEDPSLARVVFKWDEVLVEGLTRRAELRRQKWVIRRHELELMASRNFELPRLDAVGRYRFRGLGHDLLNPTRQGAFDNAYQDLTTGDFQEWALGMELSFPFGFRQASVAIRNAELLLARDRAILSAQEEEVTHDLSAAMAEVTRAYGTSRTNDNRRAAARRQVEALESQLVEADEQDKTRLIDSLLVAQLTLTEAEEAYYRSLIEHTLAVRGVHLQKGSLLEYSRVYLAEGPWPAQAYADADAREASRRQPSRVLSYVVAAPPPVSRGVVPQRIVTDQEGE